MTVGDTEALKEQDVDEEDENKAQKTDADIIQQDIIQVQDLYEIHTKTTFINLSNYKAGQLTPSLVFLMM